MLYRYQPNDIATVRSNFPEGENPLLDIIHSVYSLSPYNKRGAFLCSEQIFAEVLIFLDKVKEYQEDFDNHRAWSLLKYDYNIVGSQYTEEDIKIATAIVLTTQYAFLSGSSYLLHQKIAKWCLRGVHEAYMSDVANYFCYEYDKYLARIQQWVRGYIDSDDFLSDLLPTPNLQNNVSVNDVPLIIPEDFRIVSQQSVVPTITRDSKVYVSATQIRKAANVVDLTKASQIACFYKVCLEVGVIKVGVSIADFIKILVSLCVIKYTEDLDIDTIVNSAQKKINGQASKQIPPLPDQHTKWKSRDLRLGEQIYAALFS